MNFNDFNYSIITPNEDYKEIVIEKSGIKNQFTFKQIDDHRAYLAKANLEMAAQKQLDEAKMKNIEENHSYVKDLDDQKLLAITMYAQAKAQVKKLDEKMAEVSKALSDYDLEKSHIIEKLNITMPVKIEELQPEANIIKELQPNDEKKD